MSSMRNAVQRRNHKERAQPLERQKWGLLEKHKDYSLRAKDHNAKKARLKALRQKAADRNPDEFAFGMMSSEMKDGVRIQKRGVENGWTGGMSMDTAKLLKTQDAGYLSTVLQQTKREIEKTREEAVLVGIDIRASPPTQIGKRKTFDDAGHEVSDVHLLKTDGKEEKQNTLLDVSQYKAKRKKEQNVEMLQRKLERLTDRERQLGRALDEVQLQRAKMGNTVGGVNKDGVKFKIRERKR